MPSPTLRRVAATAALASVLFGAAGAYAHGAFPQARQLELDPSDPNRLWLWATYGLLTSPDAGQTWHWTCDRALAGGAPDASEEIDLRDLAVSGDGSVLGASFSGLTVSHDAGCNWGLASGTLGERYVVAVTTDPSDASRVLALISVGVGGNSFLNQVYQSRDAGSSWSQLGSDLDTGLVGRALEVAPSDPARLYVSGLVANGDADAGISYDGVVLSSGDGGQAFATLPLDATFDGTPQVMAVHPTNPDQILVKLDGDTEDALLHSTDGGQSFREVLRQPAELFAAVYSEDGASVLAAYGDPREEGVSVDQSVLGIYSATSAALAFERIYDKHVACLRWSARGLYACTNQFAEGFELGLSSDGGRTFGEVMQLDSVQGPLECPAGSSTAQACGAEWEETCDLLKACGSGEAPSTDETQGGCGCRAAGSGPAGLGLLSGLLIFLGVRRRRRRR